MEMGMGMARRDTVVPFWTVLCRVGRESLSLPVRSKSTSKQMQVDMVSVAREECMQAGSV